MNQDESLTRSDTHLKKIVTVILLLNFHFMLTSTDIVIMNDHYM